MGIWGVGWSLLVPGAVSSPPCLGFKGDASTNRTHHGRCPRASDEPVTVGPCVTSCSVPAADVQAHRKIFKDIFSAKSPGPLDYEPWWIEGPPQVHPDAFVALRLPKIRDCIKFAHGSGTFMVTMFKATGKGIAMWELCPGLRNPKKLTCLINVRLNF